MREVRSIACGVLTVVSLFGVVANACAADAKKPPSDKALIKSAMSAAPARVAQGASIVVMEADGKMRTLREGKNGFTCMPDNPATPGPDPMCMDKNAMEWAMAWVGHKTPAAGKVGFKLNDATGLTVFVDGKPVTPKAEFEAEVPMGQVAVTMIVDRLKRTGDVKLELTDVPGSMARVKVVGGK